MTEKKRKESIEKLKDLRNQGLLTDEEYNEKVALFEDRKEKQKKNGRKRGHNLIVLLVFLLIVAAFGLAYDIFDYANEKSKENNHIVIVSKGSTNDTSYTNSKKSTNNTSYTNYNKTMSEDEKGAALDFAQRLVKKQLSAPSTASFPWSFKEYEFISNSGICTVKGHLDAQNEYGAKIRWKFESCFDMWKEAGDYRATERYTFVYPAK